MQITTISRGSYDKGKELAVALAENLGHLCVGRKELIEAAAKDGIPVGKMEVAILKPRHFSERLLLIKEHYQAFATAYLCERALERNLVYHGRAGHLLFPGVRHVLRVKVIEKVDQRIRLVAERMNLPWEKASRYIQDVDEDLHRWVKTLYGVDWNEYSQYDMTLGFENLTARNAAMALCSVAGMPEFQGTPASVRTIENLLLASRARLALARNKDTENASFRVECVDGVATVTYRPVDTPVAERIPEILGKVDGIKGVNTTMAAAHILWIQEDFSHSEETYGQIVDLANRWNAAVELIRYSSELDEDQAKLVPNETPRNASKASPDEYNGGIEDDTPESERKTEDDGGLEQTHTRLVKDGVSGGHLSCGGEIPRLLDTLESHVKFNLVAIGNVFASKEQAARTRMRRELISSLSEKLRIPVVETEELKQTYMFTFKQAVRFAVYLVLAASIFLSVFRNQGIIQQFIHSGTTSGKIQAAAFVVVVVPLFAFLYGNVAKTLLKLVRIE